MKLTIEQSPEFIRLINYFKKIELLAEKMGVDVDDLIHDQDYSDFNLYPSFRENNPGFARRRVESLLKYKKNILSDSPFMGLSILVNSTLEKQF